VGSEGRGPWGPGWGTGGWEGSAGWEQLPRVAAGFLDEYRPAGVEGVVWEEQYTKDTEGGWVWGNHREA